ncbi:velvet factor family protein ASCRUDRAFT_74661 [Ascoidea rubescens DSM 1968]|uniref:Velvet domain-containing protein n=1 Tax=Ascoidea rubescens DSM 1968 TaxID=1344418 RepID=A0A1D2VKX1_9ASCO|nr:hypothetical protein ASCRUDRAFT_74661 [Ascoidea rubescens DSM 1968]ODV62235.1 hypothetical protein ASCRUDRAFT_74661 [Ascoidea rubescens DSM 1968]
MSYDNIDYELIVAQQPEKARMCGLGDKDRRNISPPPCIKLCMRDKFTGKQLLADDLADSQYYMLIAQLWDPERNIDLSIINSIPDKKILTKKLKIANSNKKKFKKIVKNDTSINNINNHTYSNPKNIDMNNNIIINTPNNTTSNNHLTVNNDRDRDSDFDTTPISTPGYNSGYTPNTPTTPNTPHTPNTSNHSQTKTLIFDLELAKQSGNINDSFIHGPVRNLNGEVVKNPSKVKDLNGEYGLWFVFPEISVRVEGEFKLKFSLFKVNPLDALLNPNSQSASCTSLCEILSDRFKVYIPKQFPGVGKSTELSKCFANQGIKIPIRNSEKKRKNRDDFEDEFLNFDDNNFKKPLKKRKVSNNTLQVIS